jgi:hypothetical protein
MSASHLRHLPYKISTRKKYDVVIFDVMGLICLSYMAATMKNVRLEVLHSMRRLIVAAKLVVLVQDRFSRDDVAFYTTPKSINPDDRCSIYAHQFLKKVVHHPIIHTTIIRRRKSTLLTCIVLPLTQKAP